MDCVNHPGAGAISLCTRCDKALCSGCRQERSGNSFCAECAAFMDQRAAPQQPSGDVFAARPAPPSPQEGDVYQGPAVQAGPPAGGRSASPPRPAWPVAGTPARPAPASRVEEPKVALLGACLIGLIAGFIGMFFWYELVLMLEKQVPIMGIFVGAMVGYGTRFGAGRADHRSAILAITLTAVVMFFGWFFIYKYAIADLVADPITKMEKQLGFEYDCDFTSEEMRKMLELGDVDLDWDAMAATDRRRVKTAMERECKAQHKELEDPEKVEELMGGQLTLASFAGDFFSNVAGPTLMFMIFGMTASFGINLMSSEETARR